GSTLNSWSNEALRVNLSLLVFRILEGSCRISKQAVSSLPHCFMT
ncbi:hypothetical protein CISIN_1g0416801mg, partial [Citrus sinensis]